MSFDFRPTGTCFDDCSEHFARLISEDRSRARRPDFRLVHGICLLESGKPYAHAWIEEGDAVHCSGVVPAGVFGNDKPTKGFITIDRDYFYEMYQVQECTKYTLPQTLDITLVTGDQPPPWETKYRRLCSDWKGE